MARLRTDLEALPSSPGAYLMKADDGEVLYVGKAVNLRNRVRQYWQNDGAGDGRFHVGFLVPRISEVEVVVTSTEREALLLEDTLIKKYQPRYNVKLKDDKTWLSLRLQLSEPWPRPTLVRRWRDDGARYFGPYLDEIGARKVLGLLTRTVPLRTCTDTVMRAHAGRPCIEHQMGRCCAPCAGFVGDDAYRDLVDEAVLLLEGRSRALARRLRNRMEAASAEMRFEDAARIRDSIRLLERIAEKQAANGGPETADRDVFGLHREGDLAAVALVPFREGRMQDARAFAFRGTVEPDDELLGRLITQLYSPTIPPPPLVLVPCEIEDADLRADLLGEIRGGRVRIRRPIRGEGRRLLLIAAGNARVRFDSAHSRTERTERSLFGLRDALRLPGLPRRIECFDNSHIQGGDAIGAMAVFIDGRAWKKGYRTFGIRGSDPGDDYGAMREVLGRRIERCLAGEDGWELPDLLVVDGGRGQLAMAERACRECGVDVVGLDGQPLPPATGGALLRVVSIAKPSPGDETDKVFEPGRKGPLPLRPHDPALHLLQQVRDEAHRFGLARHRTKRGRRTLRSDLDAVPGIGKVLRTRLLQHFGSVRQMAQASEDQIAAVPGVGPCRAAAIKAALGTGA